VFVKPMCVFALLGAFYAVELRRRPVGRRALVFLVLGLGPWLIHLAQDFIFGGQQRGLFAGSFLPWLWVSPSFWRGWLHQIDVAVGTWPFLAALASFVALARGIAWPMLAGLWLGYFVYGLAFTYQIHTHSYYHLQLIPIVALSLSPLASAVARHLRRAPALVRAAGGCVAVAIAVLCVRSAYGRVDTRDWQDRVRDYEAIGSAVHHSTKAVWLSEWYGGPLRYHGQVAGTNSPHQIDFNAYSLQGRSVVSGADILRALLQRSPAEFFIVTDLAELAAQPDLGRFLQKFPTLVKTDRYVVFDLRAGAATSRN
jgi:hypothetical protein